MNILEVGFRIKQAIGLTGYNVKEFCEKTERSRVTTALWISGRGGLIKDKSLEDLCSDLKKCSVSCNINWLKHEKGPSPALFLKNSSEHSKKKPMLTHLNTEIDSILFYLKKYDTNIYFDHNSEDFYAIAYSRSLSIIDKPSQSLQLALTEREGILGNFIGYSKNNNTLVLSTLNNEITCIDRSKIKKIGEVSMYIKKN